MELLTIDLTGFDVFLYTLAIAIPIILRHGKPQQIVTLEDIQDLSYDDELEDLTYLDPNWVYDNDRGDYIYIHPAIAQPKVITTSPIQLPESEDQEIEGRPKPVMPMSIAPESSITVHTLPDDQTPTDDLESLSVRQLRALCKELGYTRYSKCIKHELILIIRGQNKG